MVNNQKGPALSSSKGFAHILGLLLLVVGLGVGVYLVQQETKLFSRATSAPISSPISFVCIPCAADVNQDRVVNIYDLSKIGGCVGVRPGSNSRCPVALDVNQDGFINQADLDCVRDVFDQRCVPTPSPTPTPTPTPSSTPESYRRIFVTYAGNGNLGGLAGADAKCQQKADAAGLRGVFKAWLSSSSTSAASRLFQFVGPYRLVNGVKIADSWDDLVDGSLQNPININERGQTVSPIHTVWTGTNERGNSYSLNGTTLEYYCFDWTQNSGGGEIGRIDATDKNWTAVQGDFCGSSKYLYCFEQYPFVTGSAQAPVVACTPCGADADKNGSVGIMDMMRVAQCMRIGYSGSAPGNYSCQKADTNGDKKINAGDFSCARQQFGKQCTGPRR